jgi:hypothetical protein
MIDGTTDMGESSESCSKVSWRQLRKEGLPQTTHGPAASTPPGGRGNLLRKASFVKAFRQKFGAVWLGAQ